MFKIFVVLVGLAAVVPDKGPNPVGITTLLVDTTGKTDVLGDPIPQHSVTLDFRNGTSKVTLPAGTQIAIVKTCKSGSCTPPPSAALPHQPDLVELSGNVSHVRDACLDPSMLHHCVDSSGLRLVHTHLRLQGDWSTEASTTCSENLAAVMVEPIDWKYRRKDSATNGLSAPRPGPPQHLGNTYVFSTESNPDPDGAASDDISLLINGAPIPLSPANPSACTRLNNRVSVPCAIIELRNLTHSMSEIVAGPPWPDRHFAVLSELMMPKPSEVWVPSTDTPFCKADFVEQSTGIRPGPSYRTPPGNRCGGGGG